MISSNFSGRSTIEYFIAIATVALVFAAGLDVRSYKRKTIRVVGQNDCNMASRFAYLSHTFKAGMSFFGSIRAIFPKHSATTFRTPSSLSQ
jgi:hypothetical protein